MRKLFLTLAVCTLLASTCLAEDAPVVELFNGKTLEGWHVTGCEVEVQDGAILLKDGNGFVRTNSRYSDFVLELEWKALRDKNWDSGVYFHAELPPEGKPWPPRYQINMRQGMEGDLVGDKDAVGHRLMKPGEWNQYRLTVRGKTASLEFNGEKAWTTDKLETKSGYIGLQAEVPGGGQFLFRNLRIRELGHAALFDGKTLAGWEGAGSDAADCWKVEEGLLLCTGEKGPWLRSKEQYGDFNLRLDYRLEPHGNSGVYVRVPENGSHHGDEAGVEVQILDDSHPGYATLKPYQYSGSVYALVPAEPRVSRAAGEWNTLEIDVSRDRYRVVHNGVDVVDADAAVCPDLAKRRKEGFLGLQNHHQKTWFRNVRIGPSQP